MDKTKKQLMAEYSIALLIVIFSFLLWRSIDRAIFVPDATTWRAPIISASLLIVSLFLGIYIIKQKMILRAAFALGLASALFFAFSVMFAVILGLAGLFIWAGANSMESDLKDRVKLNLFHNMRQHSRLVVWGLCLVIAGQYYFSTRDLAVNKYIPRFELGKGFSEKIFESASNFFPALKGENPETISVDDFIWKIYSSQNAGKSLDSMLKSQPLISGAVENIDPAQKALLEKTIQDSERQEVLGQGRKQVAELAGIPVSGSERMADVFPEIVNRRINNFFLPSFGKNEKSTLFSGIIALIIFLTAISLAPFLMFLWVAAVSFIFFLLKKTGVVEVVKVQVEQEVIL